MKLTLAAAAAALILAGCAGTVTYTPPAGPPSAKSFATTLDRPFDEAWQRVVQQASQTFFVVNNLDKSSGFINLSFSGDPALFLDCGVIDSVVSNAAGNRRYTFPAASANQVYESNEQVGRLLLSTRRMRIDARANVLLRPAGQRTDMTLTFRYALTRTSHVQWVNTVYSQTFEDQAELSPGDVVTVGGGRAAIQCMSTGRYEQRLLDELSR